MAVIRASVTVVVPVGGVIAAAPAAGVTVAVPVAEIDYILLTLSARVDSTGRYRFIQETAVVLDAVSLHPEKNVFDAVGTDDFSTHNAEKNLFDSVSVTETFIRTLVFVRNFADAAGITDHQAFELVKPLTDSLSTEEFVTRLTEKFLRSGVAMNDSFDMTDGAVWQFSKSINNVVLPDDKLVKDFSSALRDTAAPTDKAVIDASKAVTDAVAASEAMYRVMDLTKKDSISLSENLAKSFTRSPFTDSILIGDNSARTAIKLVTDSVGNTDSGYLHNQGYCDPTYFAEVYVGDYRTF